MKLYAVELVQKDAKGNIQYIRLLRDLFQKKEDALEHGRLCGGDFYVLELEVIETTEVVGD